MIDDLDESLRTLLRRDALHGADVEVLFEAPTKDWAARRSTPALDVYLYDIREDLKWRAYGSVDVRGPDGLVSARLGPPRYFKFSYLVTAWTQRPEDEHRLLSNVLVCMLRADTLPKEVLSGRLAEQGLPVRVSIGLPPPEDRSLSDVWTALGGELKPSLDLVALMPIDARGSREFGPPVTEEPKFSVRGAGGQHEDAEGTARPQEGSRRERRAGAEEKVTAGKEPHPGRTYWLREMTDGDR